MLSINNAFDNGTYIDPRMYAFDNNTYRNVSSWYYSRREFLQIDRQAVDCTLHNMYGTAFRYLCGHVERHVKVDSAHVGASQIGGRLKI